MEDKKEGKIQEKEGGVKYRSVFVQIFQIPITRVRNSQQFKMDKRILTSSNHLTD